MMACWDIALCNLTEVDQHFRGRSDDGGSLYLWNVGLLHTVPCSLTEVDWRFRHQLQQNYTVLYLRTLSSSYVLSWESEISHTLHSYSMKRWYILEYAVWMTRCALFDNTSARACPYSIYLAYLPKYDLQFFSPNTYQKMSISKKCI
jgi:hypothetical protein